jgi:phosphatidylserine/phosphatidylglycerophosphate/cardiolipin synthase-like enzyme
MTATMIPNVPTRRVLARSRVRRLAVALAATWLVACGGGRGGDGATTAPPSAAPPVGAVTLSAQAPKLAVDAEMGVVTNDPEHHWTISKRVTQLIDNAPADSTIRVAQYRLASSDPHVLPALIDAFDRGVRVRIVVDKAECCNKAPFADKQLEALRAKIATKHGVSNDPSNPSFIVACSAGCIGSKIQHNKFYLFTRSGTMTKVVFQSTANVDVENAVEAWNVAYGVAERATLFNAFQDYFADLAHERVDANYYRTTTDGNLKAYFFPRASSTGDADDPTTDTIVGILDNVRCTGNATVGTSVNHRTIIRIAMWGFQREKIAQKLRALANDDCWIDLALNLNPGSVVSDEVKTALRNHDRINVDNVQTSPMWMHAKYMLIEGNYDGVPDNKVAWLGSHNFTISALRNNDESWLKIDSATAHDDLRMRFRDVMARSANWGE